MRRCRLTDIVGDKISYNRHLHCSMLVGLGHAALLHFSRMGVLAADYCTYVLRDPTTRATKTGCNLQIASRTRIPPSD